MAKWVDLLTIGMNPGLKMKLPNGIKWSRGHRRRRETAADSHGRKEKTFSVSISTTVSTSGHYDRPRRGSRSEEEG